MRIVRRAPALAVILFAALSCGRAAQESGSVGSALREFEHRKIHTTLSPETLASIPDDKLEQAIVDYAAAKLEGHDEDEARLVNDFPEGVRALYLTWVVEAEVENGGFNQYFWNTEGRFSEQAVRSFEFFGAVKHADLMREANGVRAKEASTIEKFKQKGTMEAFSESYEASQLGPLDERFYHLDEDLSRLRIAKIRANPILFSGN